MTESIKDKRASKSSLAECKGSIEHESITAYNLVPEMALIDTLPNHLQKRFKHALTLMHKDWSERRAWEEIATESAISPYHFHRQFTELFNETPGQYLCRVRLQMAVGLLINDEQWSVIDVAQYCGFSSSQSLAKALKRELGVTAKYIRAMGSRATPKETTEFIQQLAHPSCHSSMEQELAQSIPTELVWYPQRGIKRLKLASADWDTVFERYGKKSMQLMSLSPIKQVDKAWSEIEAEIGNWQVAKIQYDRIIPEGYYLCSDVYLASDVAYSMALDALFKAADTQGLKLDVEGDLVEMIRHIELSEVGGVTFSFQLPVLVPDLTHDHS